MSKNLIPDGTFCMTRRQPAMKAIRSMLTGHSAKVDRTQTLLPEFLAAG
jgi:hypothetical protein